MTIFLKVFDNSERYRLPMLRIQGLAEIEPPHTFPTICVVEKIRSELEKRFDPVTLSVEQVLEVLVVNFFEDVSCNG